MRCLSNIPHYKINTIMQIKKGRRKVPNSRIDPLILLKIYTFHLHHLSSFMYHPLET